MIGTQGQIRKVIVVSPHPDDETLGAGGTLLRLVSSGTKAYWLNVTDMKVEYGFERSTVEKRTAQLRFVEESYGFTDVFNLALKPAALDTYPFGQLAKSIGEVFLRVQPEIVIMPGPGDAHSDHRLVYQAARACTKWFRFPSVRHVLCMEIISETDFGEGHFEPQVYVDVSDHLERKCHILSAYIGEIGEHPFPRSVRAVQAKAVQRGYESGCTYAEAFRLIRSSW